MASYWVGESVHVDGPNDEPGIPILDDSGQEFCVLPEDMAYFGYGVDIDAASWRPDAETPEMPIGARLVAEIRAGNRQRHDAQDSPELAAPLEAHDPNHILYLDSD